MVYSQQNKKQIIISETTDKENNEYKLQIVKLYWIINAVNVEPREAYNAYNRAPHLKTNN